MEKLQYLDFNVIRYQIKMGNDKCHLQISRNMHEQMWIKIGSETTWKGSTIELLGMTIYYDLNFEKHLS